MWAYVCLCSIHDPWICKNVPIDLEECACIDGAGKIRTYFSIVLPLLKPILTTVVVLDALATWNDIITNQLIVGGNTVAMNIQNALYMQFSAQTADWEHALPGIVMSMYTESYLLCCDAEAYCRWYYCRCGKRLIDHLPLWISY